MDGREATAAVALIRVRGPDPEYLLLRRALNPRDPWSGHFALPGGRREAGDRDLLETCLRETREECGIRLEYAHLVRPLPLAVAGGHMGRPMGVAPFLFELPDRPSLCLAAAEIAEAHWLAQSYLRDPKNRRMASLSPMHPHLSFPCIAVGGMAASGGAPGEGGANGAAGSAGEAGATGAPGAIWGFTYGVLETFWGMPPP